MSGDLYPTPTRCGAVMTAVDLRGMPQPDNREVTDRLVSDLLDDMVAGRDTDVVQGVAVIREIAGHAYTKELAHRLGLVYRARDEARAGV